MNHEMKIGRRQALQLSAGSVMLAPMAGRILANQEGSSGNIPPRFVFIVQGNGFDGIQACPESIPYKKWKDLDKFEMTNLKGHKLPKGFAPMEKHKDRFTVIQGLSGKVTGGGHTTGHGALSQRRSSGTPQGISIDQQLGQVIPSILPWIGVGMTSNGHPATLGFSAIAAHKPLPIILNAEKAYNAYFGLAAGGNQTKDFHLKRNILDYMIEDVKKTKKALGSKGGADMEAYLSAYDELADRQYRLLKNKDKIKKIAPKHDKRFESEVATERLETQFEIATSALIGGLTNVTTITCAASEINASPYVGIGLDMRCHSYGHMGGNRRTAKGVPYYEQARSWLFSLVARMVDRLEAIPEGSGSMMDNTVIVYMSDAPDTHHSTAMDWPLVIAGNLKGKLNLGGKYITFPGYGKPGHHTVGALYSTLLNCAGKQQDSFGQIDRKLDEKMQIGGIPELMA